MPVHVFILVVGGWGASYFLRHPVMILGLPFKRFHSATSFWHASRPAAFTTADRISFLHVVSNDPFRTGPKYFGRGGKGLVTLCCATCTWHVGLQRLQQATSLCCTVEGSLLISSFFPLLLIVFVLFFVLFLSLSLSLYLSFSVSFSLCPSLCLSLFLLSISLSLSLSLYLSIRLSLSACLHPFQGGLQSLCCLSMFNTDPFCKTTQKQSTFVQTHLTQTS